MPKPAADKMMDQKIKETSREIDATFQPGSCFENRVATLLAVLLMTKDETFVFPALSN